MLLLASLVSSSCGAGNIVARTRQMFGGDLHIEVFVDPRLNQDSPVAVELVLFEDKKLVPEVAELDARDWFRIREQFYRDYKKGLQTPPTLWEWVPGQPVEPLVVKIQSGVKEGFLFANYMTPGSHREQIDPRKHFTLRLGEKGFRVIPDD